MDTLAFNCVQCKARVTVTAAEPDALSISGTTSNARLDDSFLLLDAALSQRGTQSGAIEAAGKRSTMDESFIVLPNKSTPQQNTESSSLNARMPVDQTLRALSRVYEVATEQSQIGHPLCTDCAGEVHKELEAQLSDMQKEVASYEAGIKRLEAENLQPLSIAEFEQVLHSAEQEEEQERQRIFQLKQDLAAAESELVAAKKNAQELDELETHYWYEFGDFQLQLQEHLDEKAALMHRVESNYAALNMLKRTNVYSDVFKIWHDGPFGTISGLRLGRTSSQEVSWDEINAAWGHAVLLLHTMAKVCDVQFSHYRLLPMGSYARIADSRGTYDLYGPVNKFLCVSFDKAQVGFLVCLKDYAEWLHSRGLSDSQGKAFELPQPIEGDKIGGNSIKYMLNKDKNWTKALKYCLVDLKFCLKWTIALLDRQGPPVVSLQREDPARP